MTKRQWRTYSQIVIKHLNGEQTSKKEENLAVKGNVRLFMELHRCEPDKKYQKTYSLNLIGLRK